MTGPQAITLAALLASGGGGGGGLLETLGIYWPLVLANVVVFLLFFAVMRSVLFERVRAHMEARDAELARKQGEVAALKEELRAREKELQAARKEIEAKAYERTQSLVREGVERKTALVSKAQAEAQALVGKAREESRTGVPAIVTAGEAEVSALALEILSVAGFGAVDPKAAEGEITEAVGRRLRS